MKRYMDLRVLMFKQGYTGVMLAEALGISPSTIISRLKGKDPWTIDEIYKIANIFDIPDGELLSYFPKIDALGV